LAKLWNKLDHIQSATVSGDRLVDVLHVGIETPRARSRSAPLLHSAVTARAFCHFEEIKPGGGTNFWVRPKRRGF
jgi:hypothetical protein